MSTWRVMLKSDPDVFVDVEDVQYAEPAFRIARAVLAEKAGKPDLSFAECVFADLSKLNAPPPPPATAPDQHFGARA